MQLPKAEEVPALAALRRARARQLEAAAASVVEALRPDDAPSALALPPALDLAFEHLVYRLPSGRPLLRGDEHDEKRAKQTRAQRRPRVGHQLGFRV